MNGDSRRRDRRDEWNSKRRKKPVNSAEDELESKLGFDLYSEGDKRLGWLLSFASSSLQDQESGNVYSCVDLYFVTQEGTSFKVKHKFRPYFYAATKDNMEMDVEAYLRRRYENDIANIEIVDKEDLDLKNHLSGLQKTYLKISFDTVQQLMHVRNDLLRVVERNQKKSDAAGAYESILSGKIQQRIQDFIECITDLREYDVPYHVRYAIDKDIRSGKWYDVGVSSSGVMLEERADLLQRAEVRVCAFDIETTKLPLKFPDAEYDMIMMISYMVDGQGYLTINRECVSEDIDDLEYTPKPEFEGYFKVTNVRNEEELLRHWFSHMQAVKPGIYVTYNGDFFDWPFLERRAAHYGLKMCDEVGFTCDKIQGECRSKFCCHLDCFAWVKRDSYLPQGSQGLKAVTKAKLGYDPLEVNPEDMVRFAKEKPQMMASYSVSDAVSTYYLYMTYVHPFIFSLATIIPMPPDEVLRKGSGTLCEMLLMVQAFKAGVICPNKHQADSEKFYNNQLLESETYIGGHVECLESGVFRSDIPTSFKLDPSGYHQLIKNLDRDLQYAVRVEGKMDPDSLSNYDEVKDAIMKKLVSLRDEPVREECPLIYHLDVAAMYPNIILTNRLQPSSIVTDEDCTACDFNRPGKNCLRKLEWVWRGEAYMAKRSDYYHVKRQIESETVENVDGQQRKSFLDLSKADQQTKVKERLRKYCQKAYKRVLDKPATEVREAGICMRENSFYIDTVRSFRDRRYEYKGLNKVWKGKLAEAKGSGNSIKIQEAQDMVVLYDSLQLAHKCILNSFYGYVMRKGARWYSMEMAGVVTYTGAKIIQNARILVEKIGRPLELDTDGIWCALPGSFPENFTFKTKDAKKKLTISYPCVMLNVDVARNNTNDQYQTLTDPINKTYTTHSECSIEFEVDGPYKAMIIPASKEEGILIKKRYAVFNDDGTLAELKGFEIKRRGELKLIKVFQAELFDKFLYGSTMDECYASVASVANRWLDLLDNHGKDIADGELLDYISESSTMSKSLAEYGEQKSCAVTTAKRLADFLGGAMVKDKGLRCQYIVGCEPKGTPVSERAIPVAIFETDPEIMKFYVRMWCKVSSDVGIRSIVDWSYYKQRLSSTIQKIITIPAAMQKVANPVPRVAHPDWLHKKVREKEDKFRQRKLFDMLGSAKKSEVPGINASANVADEGVTSAGAVDLEDIGNKGRRAAPIRPLVRNYEVANGQELLGDTTPTGQMCQNENAEPQKDLQHDVDKKVDYCGWLEQKKRKWKEVREKRKRQRLGNMQTSNQANNSFDASTLVKEKQSLGRAAVSSFFKRQELILTRHHWQIIQLVSSSQPGSFNAWVVVEGVMLKVPVTVPRVFYLNSKAPVTEEFPGKRVNKILPHGHRSYNLIEVTIDEEQFSTESKKLTAHLADPEVEGVYETKVTPELNALLRIGCVCKVDKTAKKRNAQDGWSVNELQMKTTTECSYLEHSIPFFYLYHSSIVGFEDEQNELSKIRKHLNRFLASKAGPSWFSVDWEHFAQGKPDLLFHIVFAQFVPGVSLAITSLSLETGISDGRAIYVGYFPVSRMIQVVVVNPYQNRELSPSLVERQYYEACGALSIEPTISKASINCKVDYVRQLTEAGKVMQIMINEHRNQNHGPVVAVIECPNVNHLKSCIQALADFPCVEIPANARDSQYQALGWQIVATKTAMQRCAASSQWLHERISLSRYAHVPLGNFQMDWLIHTIDIFFSRALRDQQHVLWISDDGNPDLGGLNEEDTCFADEVHQPVLVYPGAYRKVSVELKIHHLSVDALLKSSKINEIEGSTFFGLDQESNSTSSDQYGFDEATSCVPAFQVLKQLVKRCLEDAINSGNVFADAILQHLYRWLCSPQSKLHDPALHRMLDKVMQKVFALLVAEFRKLGSTIIFANFSKIIIDTGKSDLSSAEAYVDSVLKTLQKRDLFEWVEIEQLHFWHALLFMDEYNYGGIQAKNHSDASTRNAETATGLQDEPEVDIVSSWNIANHLPKTTQDHFVLLASEFVYTPWKYAKEQAEIRAAAVDSDLCTPSITAGAAEKLDLHLTEYLKDQISSYFTDKLFKLVRDIVHMKGIKKLESDKRLSNANSQPDVSHKGDAALEFIKHICAVLALDQRVQHDVLVMRKNLLRYIHMREFAPEVEFCGPSPSFTLPNVICSYCNDCRDLDLGRDPALATEEWRCAVPQCGQPYDRAMMENTLLQIVRQRERLYQLQDLVCVKCKMVKDSHLSEQCSCAGSFRCKEDAADFHIKMQVIHKIAMQQNFHLLSECVSWVLEMRG